MVDICIRLGDVLFSTRLPDFYLPPSYVLNRFLSSFNYVQQSGLTNGKSWKNVRVTLSFRSLGRLFYPYLKNRL